MSLRAGAKSTVQKNKNSAQVKQPDQNNEVTECEILAAQLQFAVNLLQMIPLDTTEVLSPANVSLGLTLIQQATRGETRRNINNVLLKGACDTLFSINQRLVHLTLQKAKHGVSLDIHNRIFVADGKRLHGAYGENLKKNFDVSVEYENYHFNTSKCGQDFSEFIYEKTDGTIEAIFDEKKVLDSGACITSLLNSKAHWEIPFDAEKTKTIREDGNYKNVSFFFDDNVCYDYEDKNVYVMAKKFKDGAFQFVWMVPEDRSAKGFEKFRAGLTGQKILGYLNGLKLRIRDIRFPIMAIHSTYDIIDILNSVGPSELTTLKADMKQILDEPYCLKNGTHGAVIEVDEVGVRAAAYTEFNGDGKNSVPLKPNILVRSSFVFLIHKDQYPVMIGQYNGKKEQENSA